MSRSYCGLTPEEKEKAIIEREQRMLVYIQNVVRDKGYAPTVRDIKDNVEGFSSTSTVYSYMRRLESKGLLNFEFGKPRTINLNGCEKTCNGILSVELDSDSMLKLHQYCKTYHIGLDEAIRKAIDKLA